MTTPRPLSVTGLLMRDNKSVDEIKQKIEESKKSSSTVDFQSFVASAIDSLQQLTHPDSLQKNKAEKKAAEINQLITILKSFREPAKMSESHATLHSMKEKKSATAGDDKTPKATDDNELNLTAKKNYEKFLQDKFKTLLLARSVLAWSKIQNPDILTPEDHFQIGEAFYLANRRRSLMPVFSFMTFETRQFYILKSLGTAAGLTPDQTKQKNEKAKEKAYEILTVMLSPRFKEEEVKQIHALESKIQKSPAKDLLEAKKTLIDRCIEREFKTALNEQKDKASSLLKDLPGWDKFNKIMQTFLLHLVDKRMFGDESNYIYKVFVDIANLKQQIEFKPSEAATVLVQVKDKIDEQLRKFPDDVGYVHLLNDLNTQLTAIQKNFPKPSSRVTPNLSS